MCVTKLIHMCDMTHSCVRHDSFMCVTRLIPMHDMIRSCEWHLIVGISDTPAKLGFQLPPNLASNHRDHTHTHIQSLTHTQTHAKTHTRTHIHTLSHTHTYTHTYTHTRAHTRTYTCAHTYTQSLLGTPDSWEFGYSRQNWTFAHYRHASVESWAFVYVCVCVGV